MYRARRGELRDRPQPREHDAGSLLADGVGEELGGQGFHEAAVGEEVREVIGEIAADVFGGGLHLGHEFAASIARGDDVFEIVTFVVIAAAAGEECLEFGGEEVGAGDDPDGEVRDGR